MIRERRLVAVAMGLTTSCVVMTAAAQPTPEACEEAYVRTQRQRLLEKQYLEAQVSARFCAQESCPGFVREECATWIAELERITPSFIAVVRDGDQDLAEARIAVDGVGVVSRLDGTAIPIDPGEHEIVVTLEGHPSMKQKFLFRDGEQGRRVEFRLPRPRESSASELSPWPFVVGGVGVAATAAWATLGLLAMDETNTLRDTCGVTKTCDPADVDAAHTKAIASDVFLGVAGASFVSSVILFVVLMPSDDDAAPKTVSVVPLVGPEFLGAHLSASF